MDYSQNTFKYSNKNYTLNVLLYTETGDENTRVEAALNGNDIELLRYSQSLNSLVIDGKIIYMDKYAAVDKLLSQHICYCSVYFAEHVHPKDESTGIGNPDPDRTFQHTFIVTNINPIGRESHFVKYQIDLVSNNWIRCAANVKYTNYDRQEEPVFTIFKNCLSMSGLVPDNDSFSKSNSQVKMNYISRRNDNLFSVAKFLMNKLYYFSVAEESMKFYVYDIFTNKFKILDLKNKDTALGTFSTVLSMFKTNNESMIQQEPTNLGSFTDPYDKTGVYSNIFEKQIYGYSYERNDFTQTLFNEKRNLNFLNNRIDNGNYELRFYRLPDYPSLQFQKAFSYWNNDFDFYGNTATVLKENNALILNITGDILRQAGAFTLITLDRTMGSLTNDSKKNLEKEKLKYRNFEGLWFNSKVENDIMMSQKKFRQKVVLFRNFISRPIALKYEIG